ncbi:MAG: thioesterase [Alicyclobacillus sp. RIFOXYA1_FULL_53_8]|nr:MAG: thioesterase [Alicyclobacillus sp. RIFOXYA1_FULL_53_8]
MFEKHVVVRFGECDGLGHVNNGTYFTYLEEARMDLFRVFNPSLDLKLWNLIVASTRCDFLKQASYAQDLFVFTWIGRMGNSSFVVEQAIQDIQGEWVARGQATLLAYDYAEGKPVPLWSDVRERLEVHLTGPQGVPPVRA